jgi:3-hydroxybutyryl-CoA dehydrogenase
MISTIAVIGAGTMGADVALDLANYNLKIILKDISDDTLSNARDKIKNNLKMYKMFKKELKELTMDMVFSRITLQTDYSGFQEVDLVIENVNEDWETKKKVYDELRKSCRDNAYYAVNTSCISITKIASQLPNPENVIGMHFMNPVPLKTMVEVVRGYHTSRETEEVLSHFLKGIGKQPVVVNDFPGFVANRLSHLFMNEAAFLVQDGIAAPTEIDMIFKQGYGHKMGPLETVDLIGLDTVVKSLDVLHESYLDPKFRCCPLLRKMVDAGLLGRKSGKGFYEYG